MLYKITYFFFKELTATFYTEYLCRYYWNNQLVITDGSKLGYANANDTVCVPDHSQ